METTNLSDHHIEGMLPDGRLLKVPLISEIEENLWVGGCRNGVDLPHDFQLVVSLYPWEQYRLGPHTARRETRLYDSADIPGFDVLDELADQVAAAVRAGRKTLVHCQAGLNRSNLVTALALLRLHPEMTPAEAIALLREKRSELVLCNRAFEAYLLGLDEKPVAA